MRVCHGLMTHPLFGIQHGATTRQTYMTDKILVKVVKFSSIDENLVKNRNIFVYGRKKCYLCTKIRV